MNKFFSYRFVKLPRSINVFFLFSVVGLACFTFILYQNKKASDVVHREIARNNDVIEQIEQIKSLENESEAAVATYFITEDSIWRKNQLNLKNSLTNSIAHLHYLLTDAELATEKVQQFSRLEIKKYKYTEELLLNLDGTGNLQIGSKSNYRNTIDSIKTFLVSMSNFHVSSLDHLKDEEARWRRLNMNTNIIGGVLSFVLLIVILSKLNKDIHLRKKAEEKLRKSEAKYKSLIENAGAVMYTTDLKGNITFASSNATTLTGYSADKIINRHFSFLVNPTDLLVVMETYTSQIKRDIKETLIEFRIVTRDGFEKWVEQSAVLLKDSEQVVGFQCVVRDISDKKQMQIDLEKSAQDLRKNQYYLQAILDNTTSIMYIKDVAGRYVMVNKRFKELFGATDEMVINKSNYDFIPRDLADKYRRIDNQIIDSKQAIEIEEERETTKGKMNLLSIKFPLLDSDNDVFGISGISTDITDRANYQQKLIEAKKNAEEARRDAEEAKNMEEQFLANMSHEIRTPMNGIQGMTNLLLDTPLNDQQKEFATIIKRSTNNLLVIINDILDFSKIKSGKLTIETVPFNLQEILDNVNAMFAHRVKKKGLQLILEIGKDIPSVLVGDPYRLNQVLVNLIGNAIKFTETGSIKLVVAIKKKEEDVLVLDFTVADTGIGIAEDEVKNIFESFTQANSSTSRIYGGTGLGLAISKRLVEMLGGEIGVNSVKGEGSVFAFHLPYTYSKETTLISTHLITELDYNAIFKGKTCLVVEDNEINQKLITYVLKKVGIKIDLSNNGKEAIVFLEKNKYDLIIMDLQMPIMNGYETTIYIRQQLKLTTPIIAMTATVLKGELEKCIETGMNDYMSKPFDFIDLYKHISVLLDLQATNDPHPMPQETNHEKLYNLSLLQELEDDEYLMDIVSMFLDATPAQIQEIQTLTNEKVWDKLATAAHKLKGSTGMFQANELFATLGKIEAMIKQSDYVAVEELVQQAVHIYAQIETDLQKDYQELLDKKNNA